MVEKQQIKELTRLCEKDLNLEPNRELKKSIDDNYFEDWLGEKILHLLENDFERLLNALYRIDVSEEKSKHAFKAIDNETIAKNLARLIIDRQLKKLKWRRKYASN